MKHRLIGLLIVIVLTTAVMVGCGSSKVAPEKSDESVSSISTETPNRIPDGVKIETDENGREFWRHGDHVHYLDEQNISAENNEIALSTNILKYCEENDIPVDCVTDIFNVDADLLDTTAGEFSQIFGFEMFDIKQLVERCR